MISTKPFPYQDVGADFLASRRRALLFDAPGLGKTLQAMLAAERLGLSRHDVICPSAVTTQWNSFGMDAEYDLEARSFESARDKGMPSRMQALTIDELHYCKNVSSGRTKAILGNKDYGREGHIFNADYVWGITGTPSPHDPSDLFPAMRAIVPGSLTNRRGQIMSEWDFLKQYCVMYDSGHGMVVKSGQNLPELRERLAPYVLRRTKAEVLKDWKEPVTSELVLAPGAAADIMHKADMGEEALLIAKVFKEEGFSGLRRLARVENTGISRYRRYTGMMKVASVVEWLLSEFQCGLNKIVIICYHREVMEAIAAALTKNKIKSVMHMGGMTDKQKDAVKKAFIEKAECAVFLGQLIASGTGLDGLQHATGRMLFVEYSWISDDNYQALCRLDRIGQKEPVLGQFAALDGSLDVSIMRVAAKRAKENKTLFG